MEELEDVEPTLMGLLNIGGKAMRILFGTAEDEEFTEASITAVQNREAEFIHLQGDHLTLTRRLSRKAEETSQQLMLLVDQCKEATKIVERRLEKLEEDMVANLDLRLHLFINTSSKEQQLELTTLMGLLDLRSIVAASEDLGNHWLSLYLLKPVEFSTFLSKIRNSLPRVLDLITGTGLADVYQYYALSRVQEVSFHETIRVLIDLLLSSAGVALR